MSTAQIRGPRRWDDQTSPPHQRPVFGGRGEGEGAHPALSASVSYLLITETGGRLISLIQSQDSALEVAVATELGETLWFYCLFMRSCKFQVGHQNEISYLHRSSGKLNIHHSTTTRQFKQKSKLKSPPKPGLWKYAKPTSISLERYNCVVKIWIWPHSALPQSSQNLFVVACTLMTLSTAESVHWMCPKSIDLDSRPEWELSKLHIFNMLI